MTETWMDYDNLVRLTRREGREKAEQVQWEQTYNEVERRAEVVYNPQEKAAYQDILRNMRYFGAKYEAMRREVVKRHCANEYNRRRSPQARAAYAWAESVLQLINVPTNVKLCPKCQHDRQWFGGYCTHCLWNDEQKRYPPVEFRFCENEFEQTKHYLATYLYGDEWRCQGCNHVN